MNSIDYYTDKTKDWDGDTEDFVSLKEWYKKLKWRKEELQKQLKEKREEKRYYEKRHGAGLKARALVQKIAADTQQGLEYHISNLVTMALNSVSDEPIEFEVEFVQRRNKTECDLWFKKKDGEKMDPVFSSGGGLLDVASFALRCAFWSLKKTRPVLVLDEPMKFLSRGYQPRAADMIKVLKEKLGLQFIITTHIPELIRAADKVFSVKLVNGISEVVEEV